MWSLWLHGLPMVAFAGIALILSHPRRPVGLDQTQWLAWSRFNGGWERLRIFAIIVAFCWLVISVLVGIQGISSSLSLHRDPCYRALNYATGYSPVPETWQGVRRPLPNDCT